MQVSFPRSEDANPNQVVIMGKDEDAVLDCADRIKNIEEEFMQVIDKTICHEVNKS